jgi:DUF2993 family protein
MRGCLSVLATAAALVLIVAWFGSPTLAGVVIEQSLAGAGYVASDSSVVVSSDPPLEILSGHADRVTIRGTRATIRDLIAARLELTLSNVDLVAGRFSRIDGELGDVLITSGDGSSIRARSIALRGRADSATTTVRIDQSVLEDLLGTAVRRETGLSVSGVTLSEPNRIRFTAGLPISGSFAVAADGSLVLASSGIRFTVFKPDPDLRLTSATVADSMLVLSGTMDLTHLIR